MPALKMQPIQLLDSQAEPAGWLALARRNAAAHARLATLPLKVCVGLLLLTGLLARLSPLLDREGRLYWQFMSEDGYLLQTVARNMALGLGMSTAEGTMQTNGVQPLVTFLFAALHALVGGARLEAITLVTIASALIAAAAAWAMYRVGARVLADLPHGREVALVGAALWFAAPLIMRHSMNGLETGLYYLAILVTLQHYLGVAANGARPLSAAQRVGLGALLGLTFLARNDAVFFIAGLLLAHLLLGGRQANGGYRARLLDGVVAAAVSLVVALPWLINNYQLFGSIVPISGTSQSHSAAFGTNLLRLPANLFESAFVFAPIPGHLEGALPVVAVCLLALLASLGVFWLGVGRNSLLTRRYVVASLLFMAGISAYYGLLFGAPHFLSRYTSSLSPFLWLATTTSVFLLLNRLFSSTRGVRGAALVLTVGLTAMAVAFSYNEYRKGRTHMHKQVVDWVQQHVPPEVWVGAVQTGTLGYFHDRTINLDGKVNPDALRVLLREGHVLDYVVDSKIDYVVDWVGLAGWVDYKDAGRFAPVFEVIVKDEAANLAVLRRRQPASN